MAMTPELRSWLGNDQIEAFDEVRDSNGWLPPPFNVFPSYPPTSMGWRMGGGESFMMYWRAWFDDLDRDDRAEYRHNYRAPLYWFWFYWDHANTLIRIIIMITALATTPIRIPLHWFHRLTLKHSVRIRWR